LNEFSPEGANMRKLSGVVVAIALAVAFASPAAHAQKIAVFTKNLTNPFFEAFRVGADTAGKELKVSIVQYTPTKPDNIGEQMSEVENAVVSRPDAIVFIPVDMKALAPAVAKVNAAKIPIVNAVDRSASGDFVTFVGSDDRTLAHATGVALLKAMGGKGNVVIIEGTKGSETSQQRVAGFHQALKEFPNVKLLASQPGNYQRLQALQVMENLIQTYPQIDGVLAANDAMALGALEALSGAKRKALAIGINATPEAIDAIKKGTMLASGDFDGFKMACIGTMAAVRALRHEPVPKEIIMPPVVVDKTNYQPWDKPFNQRSCPKWSDIVR
jgi:ribose transport system substrate-binding protein